MTETHRIRQIKTKTKKTNKTSKVTAMKKLLCLLLALICIPTVSCGNTVSKQPENANPESVLQKNSAENPETSDRQITMSAENITSTGMTLKIESAGTAELGTGSEYGLEIYDGKEWKKLPYALENEYELAWDAVLYLIPQSTGYSKEINWEWLYGELPNGNYRIYKDIQDAAPGKKHEPKRYYLEFTIEEPVENTCPYALMHDGVLYYDTGEYIFEKVEYSGKDILGEVTSEIPETKMPSQNGQANIPITGSIYIKHPLAESGILVLIKDKWYIFETRGEKAFTSPPKLTVSAHDTAPIEAMRGSYSWIYLDENGEETGIIADGLHPLTAKEHMPTISIKPSPYSRISPGTVYLNFEKTPQEISARARSTESFGNPDSESIPVTADAVEMDFATEDSDNFYEIQALKGEYVYEITAKWGNKETEGFEGTALYSFIANYCIPQIPTENIPITE